jgi:hypothetical protein
MDLSVSAIPPLPARALNNQQPNLGIGLDKEKSTHDCWVVFDQSLLRR